MRRVYSYGESKDKTITSIVFVSGPWVVADAIKVLVVSAIHSPQSLG
jgi:hypothetical protein